MSKAPTSLIAHRRAYIMPALLVMGLFLLILTAAWLINRHDVEIRAVEQAYEVENQLVATLTSLEDAETGQRGFLLSGDESYLAPYNTAQSSFTEQMGKLSELLQGDAGMLKDLDTVRITGASKMKELQSTIALYRGGNPDQSLALVKSNKGRDLMVTLRATLDGMRRNENGILDQRLKAAGATAPLIFADVAASTLFILALCILWLRAARTSSRLLEDSYAQVVAANAALEQAVAERTGELAQSNAHLSLILSSAVDYAIITTDLNGQVTTWSAGAEAILGWTEDEMRGAKIDRIFTASDREQGVPEREVGKAFAKGRAADERWHLRKDGSAFWASGEMIALRNAGDTMMGFLKILRDRTEARQNEQRMQELNAALEERVSQRTAELTAANHQLIGEMESREKAEGQIRQMQKMEAVGQLTGGIAHDFNNMLAIVIGSLSLMQRRLDKGDSNISRFMDAALDGATRAATLTARLLAFSRQQTLAPEPIDSNRLVTGMSELLRRALGEAVRIETVLAGGLWRIHADPSQLENAIINLAVNARDAMAEGGKLTIETANTHLDEHYAAQNLSVSAGQYVLIAITDTGSGMPDEVIAQAFDPFFTTKGIGKGTGLGLSQVHGFVRQSGGHLKIYSEVGQGTTVKIYLPRFLGVVDVPFERVVEPETALLGTPEEIILVVEDEPRVRHFAVDALRELGYTVLHADGAIPALRILDAHPQVSLLLTDIVMPDLNGRKLADAARERRPDLAVIYMTGFTRNAVVHNGVLDAGVNFLAKPFSITQLSAKIREVLKGAQAKEHVEANRE